MSTWQTLAKGSPVHPRGIAGYASYVQTIWNGRMTQVAAKYGDVAPTATACCNACRTCVQTNLLAVGLAGAAGAVAFVAKRLPRFAKPS